MCPHRVNIAQPHFIVASVRRKRAAMYFFFCLGNIIWYLRTNYYHDYMYTKMYIRVFYNITTQEYSFITGSGYNRTLGAGHLRSICVQL